MTTTAVESRIPTKLEKVAKFGDAIENTMIITSKLEKARSFCLDSDFISEPRLFANSVLITIPPVLYTICATS
jgi:hypothetical protein